MPLFFGFLGFFISTDEGGDTYVDDGASHEKRALVEETLLLVRCA